MQIEVHVHEEDSDTLAEILKAHSFEDVDRLFHCGSSDAEQDLADEAAFSLMRWSTGQANSTQRP